MAGADQRLERARREVAGRRVPLVHRDEGDQQLVVQGEDAGVAADAVGDQQDAPVHAQGVQDRLDLAGARLPERDPGDPTVRPRAGDRVRDRRRRAEPLLQHAGLDQHLHPRPRLSVGRPPTNAPADAAWPCPPDRRSGDAAAGAGRRACRPGPRERRCRWGRARWPRAGGGSGRPFAVGWEARSLPARGPAGRGRYGVPEGAPAGAYPGTRSRLA